MTFLYGLRLAVFIVSILFSYVTLGLAIGFMNLEPDWALNGWDFAALAVATPILTIVSLKIMIIVDFIRRGSFTSWAVVELSLLSLLWILWLATGADTAATPICLGSFESTACDLFRGIEALGFLTWLIILGYCITLLTFVLIGNSRGHKSVWTSSVRDTNFLTHHNATPAPINTGAPMQQHQYPPSGGAPAMTGTMPHAPAPGPQGYQNAPTQRIPQGGYAHPSPGPQVYQSPPAQNGGFSPYAQV